MVVVTVLHQNLLQVVGRYVRTYIRTYLALLLNPHDPVNGTLVHQMGTLLHRTLLILKIPWGPPV